MRNQDYQSIRAAGTVAGLGILLVVSTVVGLAIGYGLDKLLGTRPWLTILFTLFGIAAGFVEMFRIVLKLSKD